MSKPPPTGIVAEDVARAHKHSSGHRDELTNSESCGCFYCLAIFAHPAVREWVDDETTAICPHCGIDSVIGSASGFPIEKVFLERMRERWFSVAGELNE